MRSPSGIKLRSIPSDFGCVPDPPEPECDGVHEEDKCYFCAFSEQCKVESEVYDDRA